MKKFTAGDAWRIKVIAGWACVAPVGAMVLVIALGGEGAANQFVVDARAIGPRPDSVFDDLAAQLPSGTGVDGSIPTEQPSQIQVPVTGTTEGQPAVPPAAVVGNTSGIPGTVLAAYQKAANDLAMAVPGCGITWPLLAGIGKVESAHASGGRVDANGLTRGKILGPVLDGGPGMAAIADTDQGLYDGDSHWDRAVGPMQFIPGTWKSFGADGNGDGVKDPHNVFDAARAAGDYLCAGGANLKDPQGLVQAVLRYNHSMDYVSTVLRWMQTYSQSAVTVPDTEGVIPPPATTQTDEVNPPPTTTLPPPTAPVKVPLPTTTVKPPLVPTPVDPPTAPVVPPSSKPPVVGPTKKPTSAPPKFPDPQVPPRTTSSPTATPTPTPTPEPTPTPTPEPTDTPTPTPEPPAGTPDPQTPGDTPANP
ncbi:lytic transglycosylase domain-containing protein [Kribbella sp. NPDC051718]|uniref:lytic transglycosylase domain-containing protein n=1 Tax=Kribbella sp. NPDC051718 TaxID=3155168 RepID=UPI003437E708